MARPRNPKSKNTFGGLELSQTEETQLKALLKKKQRSLAQVKRYLFREWMKQQQKKGSELVLTNL